MPDAARWDAVRLDGDGFVLRRWRTGDLDALLRHANDPAVVRGLSHRFPTPYTRADGEAFLTGHVVDFGDPLFAIEIDGAACGGIGARSGVGERAQSAELGYWLGQVYWGRGLMTRAVRLYADWVLDALRLHRLQATVLAFNTGSARVLQKTGFIEEGCMRHAVVKDGQVHDLRLFARTRATID
ncbi:MULTISPECIES: GNAT family N-acetyltransferase [Luteimonas]|uniref:GNAT family N-acetyltransferase n=1 Tax=Luteimonas TaxID=83614 RepID=UPI000C7A34D7|nr:MULTISPECIES: GNAT family protein [Luteimonas]